MDWREKSAALTQQQKDTAKKWAKTVGLVGVSALTAKYLWKNRALLGPGGARGRNPLAAAATLAVPSVIGAASGAVANKEDRKRGALYGATGGTLGLIPGLATGLSAATLFPAPEITARMKVLPRLLTSIGFAGALLGPIVGGMVLGGAYAGKHGEALEKKVKSLVAKIKQSSVKESMVEKNCPSCGKVMSKCAGKCAKKKMLAEKMAKVMADKKKRGC